MSCNLTFWAHGSSELIGTCFLVMIVVGSGIMGERLSTDQAIILLTNTLATGAGLVVLIWAFQGISGAHFNPVVSLVMWMHGTISKRQLALYVGCQILGGIVGTWIANIMFDLPAWELSQNIRDNNNFFLSEAIATFGLVFVIIRTIQVNRYLVAPAVGLYITAGYWFTASTSFANPAVTIARVFTDTFTGINFISVPIFISAQILGALLAFYYMQSLPQGQSKVE